MAGNNPQSDVELPPFDELMKLAEHNPEEFYQLKRQLCEVIINNASEAMQPRLRAQQANLDLVIGQCKNPTHVNVTLMNRLTSQLEALRLALEGQLPQEHHCADILPFRPKDDGWR